MTSIAQQLEPPAPTKAEIKKARDTFVQLLQREIADRPRRDDGEKLTNVCDLLEIPLNDFFRIHAPAARGIPDLRAEASTEGMWRATAAAKAATIRGKKHLAFVLDPQARKRAKKTLAQLSAERTRASQGIRRATNARDSLERLRSKYFWAEAYEQALDGQM